MSPVIRDCILSYKIVAECLCTSRGRAHTRFEGKSRPLLIERKMNSMFLLLDIQFKELYETCMVHVPALLAACL